MKSLFTLFAVLLIACNAIAQAVYFKNNTKQPVYVTVTGYKSSKKFKGWVSEGWFYILPGERKPIGDYDSPNVYYYARSEDKTKNYGGDYKFYIDVLNQHKIPNSDMAYVGKKNINYMAIGHRKVNALPGLMQKSYTINLEF